MNKFYFIIIVFFSFETIAELKSITLDNFKSEDSKYRYFIGLADSKISESEAVQMARGDAFQNAIGELFGVNVEMSITTTASISDVNLIKNNKLSFDQVKLVKFEMIDFKLINEKVITAKILFKYPKSEIEIEKTRQADLLNNKNHITLNLYNKVGLNENYPEMTINTYYNSSEVIDADVYLNGQKVAFTPLKLRKKLKLGLNKVLIKHAQFDDYLHEFEVTDDKDLIFNFNLKRSYSLVEFKSNIVGSKVYINDNFIGLSPIFMNLQLQNSFNIKFVMEGFEDLIVSNYKVEDKYAKVLQVDMIKKYDPHEMGPGCENDDDDDDDDLTEDN